MKGKLNMVCKVSIIVPAYNVKKYIKTCLCSIKAQSFKDFECIVINDGSTDRTLSVIERTVAGDARFKVISQKNGGLSHARNEGMKLARGEYLQFIDGDDYVSPDLLEECVATLDASAADVVVFPYYGIRISFRFSTLAGHRAQGGLLHDLQNGSLYNLKDNPDLLFQINPAAWNKMWRKSLFIDNNIEFPFGKYYEDYGTTYRLLPCASSITYIDRPLYYYRFDNPRSISNQFRNERFLHFIDLTELLVSFYKDNKIFDLYYEELKQIVFGNFQFWANQIIDRKAVDCYGFIHDFHRYIIGVWPEFPECKYFEPSEQFLDFIQR